MHFYCLVRTDIPLADQICQVAHASLEAGKNFVHEAGCNLVLLAVPDKFALSEIAELLDVNCIKYFVHNEPDDDMGDTALCTEQIDEPMRKIFRHFKLWKG